MTSEDFQWWATDHLSVLLSTHHALVSFPFMPRRKISCSLRTLSSNAFLLMSRIKTRGGWVGVEGDG